LKPLPKIDIEKENEQAADWLLNFNTYKKQYIEALEAANDSAASIDNGMPSPTSVGRPTEQKAITFVELERRRQWLMTIENTEQILSEKRRVFLSLRRQAESIGFEAVQGRPGWVDFVQVQYAKWHELRYHKYYLPGRKTLFDWWNSIVNITARIAIRRGCL
jgi:hypothetical protein